MPHECLIFFHILYAYFCIQGHTTLFSGHLQNNPRKSAMTKHSNVFPKHIGKILLLNREMFMFSAQLVDKKIYQNLKTANKVIFSLPFQLHIHVYHRAA